MSEARIGIRSDSKQAESSITSVRGMLQKLGQDAKGSILTGVGLGAGISIFNMLAGAVRGVAGAFGGMVEAAGESQRVQAQTAAVIRSTGAGANVTADHLAELSGRLRDVSGTSDEVIQSGANILLTFTKVRNEVGAGNDIFDQATEAMLNMSVALGKDAASSAIMLGKALNDPVAGMTAMTRAGIQFTSQQKDQIRAMVQAGDLLGAQKVILAELETQFGGSARAFGSTLPGEVAKLEQAFDDLAEEAGKILIPALTGVVVWARRDLVPAVRDVIDWFGGLGDASIELGRDLYDLTGGALGLSEAFVTDREQSEAFLANLRDLPPAVSGILTGGAAGVDAAAEEAFDGIPEGMGDAKEDAVREARGIPGAVARAMTEGMDDIENVMADLQQYLTDEWTDAARIAYLEGQLILAQEGLAGGIAQGDSAAVSAAREAISLITTELNLLKGGAYSIGAGSGVHLGMGMTSVTSVVGAAARGLAANATGPLRGVEGGAYGIGQNTGWYYSQGLYSASSYVFGAAQYLSGIVAHHLEFAGSPPYTRAKKIGARVAEVYGEALSGGLHRLQDISGILPGGGRTSGFTSGFGGVAPSGSPIVVQLQLDGRTVAEVVTREQYYMAPGGAAVLPR